jgi:NSS family neurotransmitter:Na+ symporter
MSSPRFPQRWQSRSTFVFALAAASVGMGSIWRTTYLIGEHGGAPFMLTYVVALLVLGVPVMVAEVLVGALGRGSALSSLWRAARGSGRWRSWFLLAPLAALCGLILLAATLLFAALCLRYAFHMQLGSFAAISLAGTREFLDALVAAPGQLLPWLLLSAALLALLAAAGIRRGLGGAMWLLVPLLVVLLVVLVDFAVDHGDLEAAGRYLFARQPLDFSAYSILVAVTQALYTLAVGTAVGFCFGAYAPDRLPLCRSVLAVALFDVFATLAAGVAIYALLFAHNLQPAQGPGLLFVAVPYAFGNTGLGDFFGALFFFAVFAVCLASALALLEPSISVLTQHLHIRRSRAALLAAALAALLALLAGYSLLPGSPVAGLLREAEALAAQVLMPLFALLLAIFVGWRLPPHALRLQLSREPDFLVVLWYFLLRYAVPPAVLLVWLGILLHP